MLPYSGPRPYYSHNYKGAYTLYGPGTLRFKLSRVRSPLLTGSNVLITRYLDVSILGECFFFLGKKLSLKRRDKQQVILCGSFGYKYGQIKLITYLYDQQLRRWT